jgi:hypothetical protein
MAAAVSAVGKQVPSVTVSCRVVDGAAAGADDAPGDPAGAGCDRGLDLAHDPYQRVGSMKALCTGTYLLMLGSTLISCTLSFTCSYPLSSITSYTLSQAYYQALADDLHEGVDVITEMCAGMNLLTSHTHPLIHSSHTLLAYNPLTPFS